MIPSSTYTFVNVLVGSFVSAKSGEPDKIAFEEVTHMSQIWTVHILFFKKKSSFVYNLYFRSLEGLS